MTEKLNLFNISLNKTIIRPKLEIRFFPYTVGPLTDTIGWAKRALWRLKSFYFLLGSDGRVLPD